MDKEAVGMEREADEWETVSVRGLGPLIDALERAESKGYLPDAMAEQWAAFDFRPALTQQPEAQAVGMTDEQFIAAHGERLAAMLGIKEWWDIADRDARIKAALLSRAASSGEPVAVVRDNPDDIETIIEGLVPLEVGTQLYTAPQPSAQQAEQPAEDDTPEICDPRYFEDDEQPAEEARGGDMAVAECIRVLESAKLLCNWPDMAEAITNAIAQARAALLAAPAAAPDTFARAKAIVETWPGWKRAFTLTPYSAPAAAEALDFEPDAQHTVADMANVGYALMQAIKRHRPDYAWNESPAEIVGDLADEIEESAHSRQAQGGALGLTDKQRTAIEHAIGLAGAARMHGTADVLQSILARAASEPRAEGWQPIETAPKDGTPVLLFARWTHAMAYTRIVGWYVRSLDGQDDRGWIGAAFHGGPPSLVPSHWMPLPGFPTGGGNAG